MIMPSMHDIGCITATLNGHTVKWFRLVTSVAFLLCVWHVKFKECLQFESECSSEFLPFVKLVFPFRKPKMMRFVVYLPLEFLGCIVEVEMPRNVAK